MLGHANNQVTEKEIVEVILEKNLELHCFHVSVQKFHYILIANQFDMFGQT